MPERRESAIWLLARACPGHPPCHSGTSWIFESDVDPEFPHVVRPTFNAYPPPAYRFAETGDTIDHAAVYVGLGGHRLSAWGLLAELAEAPLGLRRWPCLWRASGMRQRRDHCLDGWYGLGWRTLFHPEAPSHGSPVAGCRGLVPLAGRVGPERRTTPRALEVCPPFRHGRSAHRFRRPDRIAAGRMAGPRAVWASGPAGFMSGAFWPGPALWHLAPSAPAGWLRTRARGARSDMACPSM